MSRLRVVLARLSRWIDDSALGFLRMAEALRRGCRLELVERSEGRFQPTRRDKRSRTAEIGSAVALGGRRIRRYDPKHDPFVARWKSGRNCYGPFALRPPPNRTAASRRRLSRGRRARANRPPDIVDVERRGVRLERPRQPGRQADRGDGRRYGASLACSDRAGPGAERSRFAHRVDSNRAIRRRRRSHQRFLATRWSQA
jgi:hypothetical protein